MEKHLAKAVPPVKRALADNKAGRKLRLDLTKHHNCKRKESTMEKDKLTNNFGMPIPDNQNSRTAGPRGPMLMEDVWFQEKMANFNREVIPERRMHAKGSGAFGTFTVTNDITKYTRAKLFSEIGKRLLDPKIAKLQITEEV